MRQIRRSHSSPARVFQGFDRLLPIDLPTVRNSGHEYHPRLIIDRVDDPVVAHPDAIVV